MLGTFPSMISVVMLSCRLASICTGLLRLVGFAQVSIIAPVSVPHLPYIDQYPIPTPKWISLRSDDGD